MDNAGKMFWCLQTAFDERLVDDELGSGAGELLRQPLLRLQPHRLEVALHAVDADGQAVLREKFFECLANTGVNAPGANVSNCSRDRGFPEPTLGSSCPPFRQ